MAKKKKRGRPPKQDGITIKSKETKIFFGIFVGLAGILITLSKNIDAEFFHTVQSFTGISAITLGLMLVLVSTSILGWKSKVNSTRVIIGMGVLSLAIATVAHMTIPESISKSAARLGDGGGYLGHYLSSFLVESFGRLFTIVIIIIITVIGFSLVSTISLEQMKSFFSDIFKRKPREDTEETETETGKDDDQYIGQTKDISHEKELPKIPDPIKPTSAQEDDKSEENKSTQSKDSDSTEEKEEGKITEEDAIKYPNWKFPPTAMLNEAEPAKTDPQKHSQKADIIEKTLKSFGIQAKVVEISAGPRVVQYALSITVGTKVSKVKALGNDLALALAAPSGSVRIEAPIPGTSLIGIEMPNESPSLVTFRELIESDAMTDFKGELPLVFGKDVSGKIIVKDLAKMPHILIAGATGSGKSVCVNAFLCGLLMNLSPDELKFILVDPKMVELPPYNGIPHLLTPVITDVEKVAYSLEWLTTEMQKRFRILNKAGVRNVQQYNKSLGYPALPYIILVVDEMADIMLTAGLDVESKIVRLAQMARAVGIHLVLATQRPSVDVLTGLIKANIPARIGMNVATTIDSRVILDIIGAETLLGNGDMLFKAPDISRPYRIQGALVSPEEIEKITDHLKSQVSDVNYDKEIVKPQEGSSDGKGKTEFGSEDELFGDAVKVVVSAGKASSSLLQRRLRIGYNRAARLIDELYEARVVGPQDGSKPRDVLISSAEAFLQQLKGSDQEDI